MPVAADLYPSRLDDSVSPEPARLPADDPVRSVLYIGDDPEQRALWCNALTGAGYVVTASDSPAAGLSAYVEHRFDAVLLSFHMRYVSSGLLATVMRLFQRGTPLILLSDSGGSSEQELAPFDRVFPRNTAPAAVLGSLHGLIERARCAGCSRVVIFPSPKSGNAGE
jgi:CheY-like chemotaxis protein